MSSPNFKEESESRQHMAEQIKEIMERYSIAPYPGQERALDGKDTNIPVSQEDFKRMVLLLKPSKVSVVYYPDYGPGGESQKASFVVEPKDSITVETLDNEYSLEKYVKVELASESGGGPFPDRKPLRKFFSLLWS